MKTAARRTALALAAAILVAPALTGCTGLIEGVIEQATDGQVDVSFGSLPDGWPEEVPVIDGEIIAGGGADDDSGNPGWNVTVTVDEGAFDEIKAQLEGAGFTQVDAPDLDSSDTVSSGAFSNDSYGVLVAVTGGEGNFVANYTVVTGGVSTE